MSKYRPSAGHIMIECLYGEGSHIERTSSHSLVLRITPMSKQMHLRPIKLIQGLEWLQSIGLIKLLSVRRYDIELSFKAPLSTSMVPAIPLCEEVAPPAELVQPIIIQTNESGW